MGNTKFWYVPDGAPVAGEIDFNARIMERQGPTVAYNLSTSETYSGITTTRIYGGRVQVRYRHTWERKGDGSGDLLRRKLFTLIAHLQRGGSVAVAEDSDFPFAAFATNELMYDVGAVDVGTNLFANFKVGVSIANRECMVQSDPDELRIEHKLCSSHTASANRVVLQQNVIQDLSEARWVLLREYGSYPALRLPPAARNGEFLTHSRERVFTLDLPLEEDVQVIESLAESGNPLLGTAAGPELTYNYEYWDGGPDTVIDHLLNKWP